MDELKMKHLLARHTTRDMDKLELTRRVQSEHLFVNVDEAIDYLGHLVSNKSFNPDDMFFMSFKRSPILVINIVDEAVCSIIYEIYQQIYRKDNDMLAYIRNRITEFRDELMNKVARDDKDNWPYYDDLFTMFMMLDFLSFPVYHREESLPHQVSYAYYSLMCTMYKTARPYDTYCLKLHTYYESKKK